MSPALLAGLIRGISTHLWIYETSPKLAAVSVFHLVSTATNGTVSLPTRYVLGTVPSVVRARVSVLWPPMASGRYPWCGVSQVVKNAQSRGRTERTLAYAMLSAGAPSRGQGMLRKGVTSLLMSHYRFAINESSC